MDGDAHLPAECYLLAMGETMEEGTVAIWHAHTGDYVRLGQVIAQIETNKAVFDLESPANGFLRVVVPADRTVPVLTILAVIEPTRAAALEEQTSVEEPPVFQVAPEPEPPAWSDRDILVSLRPAAPAPQMPAAAPQAAPPTPKSAPMPAAAPVERPRQTSTPSPAPPAAPRTVPPVPAPVPVKPPAPKPAPEQPPAAPPAPAAPVQPTAPRTVPPAPAPVLVQPSAPEPAPVQPPAAPPAPAAPVLPTAPRTVPPAPAPVLEKPSVPKPAPVQPTAPPFAPAAPVPVLTAAPRTLEPAPEPVLAQLPAPKPAPVQPTAPLSAPAVPVPPAVPPPAPKPVPPHAAVAAPETAQVEIEQTAPETALPVESASIVGTMAVEPVSEASAPSEAAPPRGEAAAVLLPAAVGPSVAATPSLAAEPVAVVVEEPGPEMAPPVEAEAVAAEPSAELAPAEVLPVEVEVAAPVAGQPEVGLEPVEVAPTAAPVEGEPTSEGAPVIEAMLPWIAVAPVAEHALPSEAPVEAAAVLAEPFEGQAEPLPSELPDAELEPLPEAEPVFHLPAGLPPRTGASPRARRAARQAEVDINRVQGTGPFGRVEQRDVDAYLETRSAVQPQPGAAATAIRRVIAQRMIRSAQSTAPVTLVTEVDATELVLLRQRLEPMIAGRTGYPLSYDLLLARIVGLALGEFPALNAHITDQGAELVENVNLGIAVDTPRGLLVPVLHDVCEKDLESLARELGGLMDRARRGSILPSEMEGGTFTITNLGGYGVDAFTPLINLPECAILGVGRIAAKPVVQQGQIAIRQMMTLSLTFDHRVVDGGPAARFLQRVSHLIQTAGSLTQL